MESVSAVKAGPVSFNRRCWLRIPTCISIPAPRSGSLLILLTLISTDGAMGGELMTMAGVGAGVARASCWSRSDGGKSCTRFGAYDGFLGRIFGCNRSRPFEKNYGNKGHESEREKHKTWPDKDPPVRFLSQEYFLMLGLIHNSKRTQTVEAANVRRRNMNHHLPFERRRSIRDQRPSCGEGRCTFQHRVCPLRFPYEA